MKYFILFLSLTTFTNCKGPEIITEHSSNTFIYKTKTGIYRVTNTFTRKVDTLSQPASIIKRIRMIEPSNQK